MSADANTWAAERMFVDVIDRWKTNAGYGRKILEHSGMRGEDLEPALAFRV